MLNDKLKCLLFYLIQLQKIIHNQSLLPLLPPGLLVESVGIGVTSSILPIFMPIYV